jgi:hypothetical protein
VHVVVTLRKPHGAEKSISCGHGGLPYEEAEQPDVASIVLALVSSAARVRRRTTFAEFRHDVFMSLSPQNGQAREHSFTWRPQREHKKSFILKG